MMAEENSIVQKIKDNSKTVTIFGCVFVGMVFLSYQLMQSREKGLENDVIFAQNAFQQWKEGKDETFSDLEAVLKKRKSLHSKYSSQIAQTFLDRKNTQLAEPYLESSFERLSTETPYHRQFSKTTLLITQKEYLAALVEARSLKAILDKAESTDLMMLKAFNLFRIAFLEKEAGSAKGELDAWEEVEALDAGIYAKLNQTLEQQFSLSDYINHRKSTISR